jgi:AGZA family xanthine/uracil permease-like MFS transporter
MAATDISPHDPLHEPRNAFDRYFDISARGSTLAREIRGGLATFFTMSYIVVLNPLILAQGKDSTGASLDVTRCARC